MDRIHQVELIVIQCWHYAIKYAIISLLQLALAEYSRRGIYNTNISNLHKYNKTPTYNVCYVHSEVTSRFQYTPTSRQ